ncbi:BBE domain-containing protein, partial [Motilibacter deserti]
ADAGSPSGLRNYWKGGYLREVGPGLADAMRLAGEAPSPLSHVEVHLLGGAHGREPEGGAAYGHRDAVAVYDVISTWRDPAEDARHVGHCRAAHAELARSGTGETYVNYLAGDEPAPARSAYDGSTLARLQEVKRRVDPDGFLPGPVQAGLVQSD